ncbi:ABC transporter substrate-binding protein [Paenarthrobacter aurescens]|uniref:Basic amino acid ABC transporter substrate-binding protein n=1 Tax=Paenarthrobacter aurescens TaxID=43663 RepID=A0A4Y3NG83_PAEAU|nr:ABC transporter substrate-binding protein [Paenarthrobacter aurescens]UKA48894.1 ABC transporter substrate-binding protein [Arthrobacter sp. FW305-123]MDO6144504.1 ABC transporter substrate-binding protein [Paenarthrobacter aurescens]MDO6148351.1 ABC transporter substrate-binding protein [Paenarthrobacter aurescens]MDO6159595.1 ABC transporter substrate-binding protein [Paenarthrobacter aurescens]MDO6163578.1 ABC transporter substrate-binding protein [Paenarthrobacter aurescens]
MQISRSVLSGTKIAAVLAAGALALTACGGSSTPAATNESGLALINAGKLTVCSDVPYEPFEFQKDGKIVGFDMDIAAEIAKDVKAELNVVDSSFEAIETGTALTGCDVSISSISITDTRKNVMDFSTPYLDDDLTLVATSASGITNLDGAKGKKVGVQQATTGAQYAKDKGIDAQQFEDSGLLVQALKAGTIDAAVGNQSVLGYAIKDDSNLKRVEDYATGEKLGISIKKGNTAMADAVNATLKRITDDGTLKKFETTWFGEATK